MSKRMNLVDLMSGLPKRPWSSLSSVAYGIPPLLGSVIKASPILRRHEEEAWS